MKREDMLARAEAREEVWDVVIVGGGPSAGWTLSVCRAVPFASSEGDERHRGSLRRVAHRELHRVVGPALGRPLVEGLLDTLRQLFGASAFGVAAATLLGIFALFTFISNTTTWASRAIALAISTSCRMAAGNSPTAWFTSTSMRMLLLSPSIVLNA